MQNLKKRYFKQMAGEVYDSEIKYLEANKNYTIVHFVNGFTKNSGYTLMRFEELLNSNVKYKRIHRAFIVNMNFVENVNLTSQDIIIQDGPTLHISRRKMKKLEGYFRTI